GGIRQRQAPLADPLQKIGIDIDPVRHWTRCCRGWLWRALGRAGSRSAVYCVAYMGYRTQGYLTEEQPARMGEMAERRHMTMAEVVRRALDAYLDLDDDVDATFGAAPGIRTGVPNRDEWARG